MIGVLEPCEIERLVQSQQFGRLGCHWKGKIYVVPISYAYDGERLVGQTTPGMKTDIMRSNPEVCVEIDDVRNLADWRSAILWGKYEELSGLESARAMGLLIDKFGPIMQEVHSLEHLGRNVAPEQVDHAQAPQIVYAIHITERTGRFEGQRE